MKEHADRIEVEEMDALLKMAWSYMVFSTSPATEKDYYRENAVIWEKLAELLNQKVSQRYALLILVEEIPLGG